MSDDERSGDRHVPGTGGLTFEPPTAESSDLQIGFAKELLDDVEPHPAFADLPTTPTPSPAKPAAPARPPGRPAAGSPASTSGYPRARAAIARLLTNLGPSTLGPSTPTPPAAAAPSNVALEDRRPRTQSDTETFSVGPAVMRAPPAVQTPAPERPTVDDTQAQRAVTKGRLEDMVDLMFMGSGTGDDDDPASQQIHLQFKEDVLDGLYVTLVKVDGGMRATFVVRDANSRRLVDGHVQNLVARLSSKGITIVDTVVEVQEVDKGPPARHGFDKDDHFDEL